MSKYRITNIDWDVDDPRDLETLPKSVTITLNDLCEDEMDEIDLILGDYLSDVYGFCHNGFSYEEIN